MKGFVLSGIVLSWVFLASSLDATAGDRVKSSDLTTSCNIVGFVNKPTNSYVFAGCCYESIGGGPISLEELLGDQLSPGPDGDKVAIWDVLRQNYTIYMKDLLGWTTNAPSTRVIEMGEGVCFQASRPIMWVVRRPYRFNL